MTDAQEAHLRLLEKLRGSTRTHECKDDMPGQRGGRLHPDARAALRKKLEECFARGLNRKQAAEECHCSGNTIVRMFGRLYKRPRKHGNARTRRSKA